MDYEQHLSDLARRASISVPLTPHRSPLLVGGGDILLSGSGRNISINRRGSSSVSSARTSFDKLPLPSIINPFAGLKPAKGDVLIPISESDLALIMAGGTWTATLAGTVSEVYDYGSNTGTSSGTGSGLMADGFSSFSAINETISTLGTFYDTFDIEISAGWDAGPRLGVSIEGIIGTNGVDTGYGTMPTTILDYDIPTRSHWLPGWAGYPGYINTTVTNLVITFSPL